jgi:hypothetical protein
MIESQLPMYSEFIIFSYGSNSVDQLEERLEARPYPLKCDWLNGFERAFFGTSKKWGKSTATLISGGRVAGLFIKFRLKNDKYQVRTYVGWENCTLRRLMKEEGVNIGKYQLKEISKYSGIPLFAFVHSNDYSNLSFTKPSDEYIKAIAKTLQDRRILLGHSLTRDPYVIDVRGIDYITDPPLSAVVTPSLNTLTWKVKQGSYWVTI